MKTSNENIFSCMHIVLKCYQHQITESGSSWNCVILLYGAYTESELNYLIILYISIWSNDCLM